MVAAVTSDKTFPSPAPITANLVWCLDAQNLASYPGSGTTWTDLSGGGRNGTLTNCTFNNTTGNVDGVVFNGSSSSVVAPIGTTAITNVSICVWAYITLNTNGCIIKTGNNNGGYSLGIGNVDYTAAGNNVIGLYSGIRWMATGRSYGTTGWHLVTMSINATSVPTIYLDNSLVGTYTGTNPVAPTTNWALGTSLGDSPTGRYFNGKIGAAYIYSAALSATDVSTIYTALAKRTGLL